MEELRTKKCAKCGCEKPITLFHRKSASPDGLQGWCKSCQSESNRKRYSRRKEISKTTAQCAPCDANSSFAQMQPREIIAEIREHINFLRANGWAFEGKLTYTQTKEVTL